MTGQAASAVLNLNQGETMKYVVHWAGYGKNKFRPDSWAVMAADHDTPKRWYPPVGARAPNFSSYLEKEYVAGAFDTRAEAEAFIHRTAKETQVLREHWAELKAQADEANRQQYIAYNDLFAVINQLLKGAA
jgi:hypothetical protein